MADGRRRWLKSITASMGCTLSCKPAKSNKGQPDFWFYVNVCHTVSNVGAQHLESTGTRGRSTKYSMLSWHF
jgi:hypothetical protein